MGRATKEKIVLSQRFRREYSVTGQGLGENTGLYEVLTGCRKFVPIGLYRRGRATVGALVNRASTKSETIRRECGVSAAAANRVVTACGPSWGQQENECGM